MDAEIPHPFGPQADNDTPQSQWDILSEPNQDYSSTNEDHGRISQGQDSYNQEREDFNEEHLTLNRILLPQTILGRYEFLSELPQGIAVMGGVARSIAREVITGEREPIRDIDLINIVDDEGDGGIDLDTLNELAYGFMPDDYTFGHGIGKDTLDGYFGTRDFTINQSLIMGDELIISDFAYNDLQENIIRPTYYELPDADYELSSRLFLKALMMRSVVAQFSSSVPLLEDVMPPRWVGSFDIALFLNKAMSRGAKTARSFTEDLAEWGIVSGRYAERPVALAKSLLEDVYDFEFRPSTDERFQDIAECDDMGGFFIPPVMADYYTSDPVIRKIIEEYDSGEVGSIGDEERVSGRYTQAEYDDINSAAGLV